jgi:DNA polymerase elongation subunit (family B)
MNGLPTIESAPLNYASLYPNVIMTYNGSPDRIIHIDFEEGGGEDAGKESRWVVFMDELED